MVGRSVRRSDGNPFFFQTPCSFLYENHRGRLTLTFLNVLGVLDVLYVLNVLHVLNVLNKLMDASLACWALFF